MIALLLIEFGTKVGLTPLAQPQLTLATGLADALFNRLVDKYAPPGVFKKTPDAATRHAVEHVKTT